MGVAFSFCAGPICTVVPANGTAASNETIYAYPDDGVCRLSPFDTYFSTVLGAFTSTIIAGVTCGYFVPFFIAWTSWFASLRIVLVAIWQVCEVIRLRPVLGGDQFFDFWETKPVVKCLFSDSREFNSDFFRRGAGHVSKDEDGQITFLGAFGWLWSTCYAPTIQVLWLVKNWDHPSGGLMIVRGLGVAVAAIPLTLDVKARYGELLGKLMGGWAQWLFSAWSTISLLTLAVLSVTELILGVVKGALGKSYWIIVLYVIFMLIWTFGGFSFGSPTDEGYEVKGLGRLLAGFAMGCFGGVFVAAPALVMMLRSPHSPGLSLEGYIHCQSLDTWEKITAILP